MDQAKRELAQELESLRQQVAECTQAMAGLRAREQWLSRTLDSLRDAVFILDAATLEVVDCNAGASEIFGYSRNELLGQTMARLYVDVTAFKSARRLSQGLEKSLGPFDLQMKRKDGKSFAAEYSSVLLEDEQDNHLRWVSVVRDITQRERAERALRRSEEHYRRLLDSVTDYVYSVKLENGRPVATAHGPVCCGDRL